MTAKITHMSATVLALTFGLAASATTVGATEGYFALGYGPVQRGQGGAGVAHSTDAMAGTVNPAGITNVGRQFQGGLELFIPKRGYEGTGTFFVPPGEVRSDRDFFLVPNIAYNLPLNNGAVLNFAMYGNGGMNTTYPAGLAGCGSVFCGGPAGVDLNQLFISATYARKIGNLSYGVAPTIAVQAFKAEGLGAFSAISVAPGSLTDNGYDWAFGVGLRAGLQYEVSPTVRVGVSAQTKINMTKFDKYAGLYENGGDFDIPASVSVGVAVDAGSDLTLMADYQRIFYSDVGAVGNAGDAGALGAPGGAGFGWDDVGVAKFGVEWRKSNKMTWRAGYAYSTNPIGPEDVTLNILAPGVVKHHVTLGGTYMVNSRDSMEFAFIYAAPNSVSGAETTPSGPTPGLVEIDMNQFSATVGWTRRF